MSHITTWRSSDVEGHDERPSWSNLTVGIAECPKHRRLSSPAWFLPQFFCGVMPIIPPLFRGSVGDDHYWLTLISRSWWAATMVRFGLWHRRVPKKWSPMFSRLVFADFFVCCGAHGPPLLCGSIMADNCQRPIVPGVVMDGCHGRVLGGCRHCTRNSLNFLQSHVGIVHLFAHN